MKGKTIEGPISINSKGVGFFDPIPKENGKKVDRTQSIEIQPENVNRALPGDTVVISLLGQKVKNREQGKVEKIIKRAREEFVGVVEVHDGKTFVVPDDKRIYVDIFLDKDEGVNDGDKVLVKIVEWDTLTGEIVKVIGAKGENNTEMEAIVLERGFRVEFPPQVEREAEKIKANYKLDLAKVLSDLDAVRGASEARDQAVHNSTARGTNGGSNEEMREIWKNLRRDMRATPTMTIDPADAKDFDDAISYIDNGDGTYEIGVHIADVSYFVTPGTELDTEAEKRGTSVYLVDRTIPMLPEILSNDLCSINPNEDKYTFSAVFKLDENGKVLEEWFGRTVIHSDKRFTYEIAQDVIDGKQDGPFQKELRKLNEIAKKLEKAKQNNGAINFEKDEVKFKLDEKGKPISVYVKKRLDTHKLIEEYMLLANRAVAKHIFMSQNQSLIKGKQSVYRIHDKPDKERIIELATFLKALGFELKNKDGEVTSKDINKLLKEVEGTPNEELIKTATIRSMAKAVYSTKNIGHFGLAFTYYTHFTSPIRRYPDMLVHRFLEREIKGGKIEENEYQKFENICLQNSELEKRAADAERASVKYKQVEYMTERIGEEFMGTITGVSEWGVYIEENETKCEGMIKLKELGDDFWQLDEKNYTVKGQSSGKKYTLGDVVKFKVVGADLERRVLDYKLV